jgi:hypothetical protein
VTAADMVMSPFGKRSQLYERLQSGEINRMPSACTPSTNNPGRLSGCSNSCKRWVIDERTGERPGNAHRGKFCDVCLSAAQVNAP